MRNEHCLHGSAAALGPVAARPRNPLPTQPDTRGQAERGAAAALFLSLTHRLLAWVCEFVQFDMIGATVYIVDTGLFDLFQRGPLGFLAGYPNIAQFVATATATLYSWVTSRL